MAQRWSRHLQQAENRAEPLFSPLYTSSLKLGTGGPGPLARWLGDIELVLSLLLTKG